MPAAGTLDLEPGFLRPDKPNLRGQAGMPLHTSPLKRIQTQCSPRGLLARLGECAVEEGEDVAVDEVIIHNVDEVI